MGKDKAIIKLNGGLGNQMFQWAFARMIEETTDVDIYLDMSYFSNSYARPYELNKFVLEPKFVTGTATKLKLEILWALRSLFNGQNFFGLNLYVEPQFNFDRNISRIKPNSYIAGFFQSELYFRFVANKLRDDFKFDLLPNDENRQIIQQINSGTSISLHIRRGDYVQKKRYAETYATCSPDYYKRAVEYIADKYPDPTIFVFSDDSEWVQKHLRLPYKCVFVTNNKGKESYNDMRLMSLCSHNIIANSTFSWWGAWLNNNEQKIVVAPKKWFNDDSIIQTDIIPKNWIKLDN